jgi:hypothetical protein
MDPAVITAITGGVSLLTVGALIKIVRIFLRHIEKSETRQEAFLGNHLSHNTKALERVANRLERMEEAQRASQVIVRNADEVKVNK